MQKPFKPKFCKQCKIKFTPDRPLQSVCSASCAYKRAAEHNRKKINKQDKQDLKARKEKTLTHSDWLNLFQKVFNTYIRLRDKSLPCISCETTANIQYHAGHYFSLGANPALRFQELNVHKQCVSCNNYLHGNLINYRDGIIKKIGEINYEALVLNKGNTLKLSIPEIKDQIKIYKDKIKQLK